MRKLARIAIAGLAITGLTAAGIMMSATEPAHAQAAKGGNCVLKASEGTNTTEEGAKFQAFEALLQATDWGAWASWMSNGTTPGYDVAKPQYKCAKGGLGVTCRAQTKICKK